MTAAAFWGLGIRKSCVYMIGVRRWAERYVEDVYGTVQACRGTVNPMECDLSKQAC
jgi:hypothetical protein